MECVFSRILVPYDGSGYSDRALAYAVKMAKGTEAKIVLLNVVEEIPIPPMIERPHFHSKITGEDVPIETYLKELYQDLRKEVSKMLEAKREEYDLPKDIVETKVVVGYPTEEILRFAKEGRFDLIVMGTKGLKGIARVAALGSVARRVLERAECPVLLVH